HLSIADIAPELLRARHLHATGIPPALSASATPSMKRMAISM
ncbi:sugar kinase, partial [Pseudomonas chlororaphis]